MEKFVLDRFELSEVLGLSQATVQRLMSQEPTRLPPAINLGKGRQARRVWLIDTVKEWLKQREVVDENSVPHVHQAGPIPCSEVSKRTRGRPPKQPRTPG